MHSPRPPHLESRFHDLTEDFQTMSSSRIVNSRGKDNPASWLLVHSGVYAQSSVLRGVGSEVYATSGS